MQDFCNHSYKILFFLRSGKMIPADLERRIVEAKQKVRIHNTAIDTTYRFVFSCVCEIILFVLVPLQGFVPFFVSATAGTTVYGAFDPLIAISDVCKKYNVWMHVDVSNTNGPFFVVWNHKCFYLKPSVMQQYLSTVRKECVENTELSSEFDKSIMSVSPLTARG